MHLLTFKYVYLEIMMPLVGNICHMEAEQEYSETFLYI